MVYSMGVGDSLVICCLNGEVRCGAGRRWSSLIGQMGKSGQGEARQGKAVRGEVKAQQGQGNGDRCVGKRVATG